MLLSQHSEFVGCTTFFDLSCAGYLGVITISHGSFVPTTSTRDRWVQLTLHAACQMLDCIPIFGDGHQSIYIPILMIRIMRWMTISHTAFFWPWNVWSHLRSLLLHCWSATNQVDTGRNPSMVIAGSMLIRWMGTQDIQSERYFRLVNSWETIKSRWRCTSAWVLGPGRWVWLWGWAHVTHMSIMLMVNETLGFNVKSCWI